MFSGEKMKSVSKYSLLFFIGFIASGFGCQKTNFATLNSETIAAVTNSALDDRSAKPILFLQNGEWGASSINSERKIIQALFSVSENGAILDLGCGMGVISKQIEIDENGFFDTAGTFQYQGGAQPVYGYPELKAHFHGQVIGNILVLAYSLDGSEEQSLANESSLTLNLGVTGQLLRCL